MPNTTPSSVPPSFGTSVCCPSCRRWDWALSRRCAELHTYGVGGGLMERDHKDSGSSLTMSLLLSDTAAFEGGRFLTYDAGGAPVEHDVQCGDGILFRSEDLHNVTPLERGVRHALVLELWVGTTNCVDRER